MAELFDKDGNPVEGALTQEELDAKLAEEKAAWQKEAEESAQKAADEAAKKAADEAAQNNQTDDQKKATDDTPEWAKNLIDTVTNLKSQVDSVSGNQVNNTISPFVNAVDEDKREDFQKKFDSLQGYDDTPEGIQQKAADAYLLTTGQRYEESGVDMRGFTGVGRGPTETPKNESPEAKAIDEALGISDEDKQKYGNNS